jgi:16S rRNA (uracil1498-N3)-methyltransferase
MSAPRFFCPGELAVDRVGTEFMLPDLVAHHALRVLRLAVGDAVTLFNGSGGQFAATLIRADKRAAVVRVDHFDPIERESPLAMNLAQGIAATDAMDHAVRRAVELGAASIQPLLTVRSARLPAGERGEKRLAHWRQIVVAACEQCGRNRVPGVHDAQTLERWLGARATTVAGLVLAPESGLALAAVRTPHAAVDLLVGPEGGLAADEVAAARDAGMTPVRLGPRVLRTETAALTALACINALWGDFR